MASLACGGSGSTSAAIPKATSSPEQSAWYACTLFVDDQLDIPFTDAQKYNASRVVALGNSQYQVTVFYAKLDNTYQCVVLRRSSGDFELLSLKSK
jgi:hypothetical protein